MTLNNQSIRLYDFQLAAVDRMKNGCILCGDVGSGKSLTALAYYYLQNGGSRSSLESNKYVDMKNPKDLYIITTPKKRDSLEWDKELARFIMSRDAEANSYQNTVIVDSWNNIKKYKQVKNAFFIFDEQKVTGYGAWAKTFLYIVKSNDWIILSATPGDTWMDYVTVFIGNGFYRNKSEFAAEHVIYNYFSNYKKIERYVNVGKLEREKRSILIPMDDLRQTKRHHEYITCGYDKKVYRRVMRDRWNVFENRPVKNVTEMCYLLRKVVNSDPSRVFDITRIFHKHDKLIVYYNFNYELDILRNIYWGDDVKIAEYNGERHDPVPKESKWVYLIQYYSGSEGWNCTETNAVAFYSQTYSFKMLEQACGRIDRIDTPFKDLYYYHLKSNSSIDLSIEKALKNKKKFNESNFMKW